MLVARNRIRIPTAFGPWVEQAALLFPVREAPLNITIALRSLEIDLPYKDPADRFIAATSIVYELVLLTVDDKLIAFEALPTRSA